MHSRIRQARRLKLSHDLAHPPHIRIDRTTVIPTPRDRKIDIGNNPDRIIRMPVRRRGDPLNDRVLLRSRRGIRHQPQLTRAPRPVAPDAQLDRPYFCS